MKSVNLSLGSGGSLGFVHIGVIKNLLENKINISAISGASAGALIGSLYSLTMDIDYVEKTVIEYVKDNPFKLFELSSFTDKYNREMRIKLFFEEIFREKMFKDTKIPFAVATCDLETGKEYDISTGRILDAVFASMSVPGVFGPTFFWGRWLVDGALVNPTPISLSKKLNTDFILGVDLTRVTQISFDSKPSQFQVIGRTIEIMTQSVALEKNNPYENINTMILYPKFKTKDYSFSQKVANEYIKLGYETTNEQIDKIKELLKE